ncbi:MAG: discoidin domain-containing protein [Terriglobia bacterium]
MAFTDNQNAKISRRKFLGETAGAAALSVLPSRAVASARRGEGADRGALPSPGAVTLRVDAAPSAVVNSFDPDASLGSSMDELSPSVVDKIYTPEIIRQCLSAGWGPITYRNHTELAIEAWHWNHNGTWSDPAHQRGYFVGDSKPSGFLRHSFGYPLPHRGSTRNGGASRGASRLTDGNPATFWKSNPYLTRAFAGEDDALHPQWVIIDLSRIQKVNAIRIHWCEPSARVYEVQYWTGDDPMNWEAQYAAGGAGVSRQAAGRWNQFTYGMVRDGDGGVETLKLAGEPVATQWIRILMTQSSNRPGPHGAGDVRHRVGYAIYEVYAGTLQDDGTFVDLVKHSPDENQTATYCSSTDPWHSASDLNAHGDQTGFDLFFTSGITNNLPAMIPVAVLFSTPEDAAAQISYLKSRGYPLAWVEMGEECDGQYCMPEDYAALYIQFAAAIHNVHPDVKLGGPVFQGINQDITVWPDAQGRTSWFERFLDYLKAHGRIQDLSFVSFEHYPFDPCSITWADLYREPELTRSCLQALRDDGLPRGIPLMNTESNVSWNMTQYMGDIFSGLWLADSVGCFFLEGGAAYYHSPIQPQRPNRGCHGWGTWSNFICDANLNVSGYTAEYYASQLINLEWVKHHAGVHNLYRVLGTVKGAAGNHLVTSYAVERPDGDWAVLLINKDQDNARAVRIEFENVESGKTGYFSDPVSVVVFGSEQYVWHSDGLNSHPDPHDPPRKATQRGGARAQFTLPKASITVLRAKVEYS